MGRIIGLDWETSKAPHLHPWDDRAFPVSLCIVDESGFKKTWIFNHNEQPTPRPYPEMLKEIQEEIDKSDRIVGHNLKFDINWLSKMKVKFDKQKLWCSKVVEYLISGHKKQSYSLSEVSIRRGITPKIDKVKTFWEAGYETSEVPLSILIPYGEQDCFNTLSLYQKQVKDVKRLGLGAVVSIEMEKMRVLSHIECNGMKVNSVTANNLINGLKEKLEVIDFEIRELSGIDNFSISSNDELSAVLYGGVIKREGVELVQKTLKNGTIKEYERRTVYETKVDGMGFVPPKGGKTKKEGVWQVNKDVLLSLKPKNKSQKKMIEFLIERSKLSKALETFIGKDDSGLINKIMSDGCVHPEFNQSVTRTGRLSSSNPNGQNIPRSGTSPVKTIFVPKYYCIGNIDASQLEWRVAAYLSQDPVMINEILGGVDIHLDNAIKHFGDAKYRTDAKVFAFRLLYGGTAYGMYMDSTMPRFSLKKWEGIVESFYEKYNVLQRWQNTLVAEVYKTGQLVLPSGRILAFEKVNLSDGSVGYNRREILNRPVQSFATADIFGLVMCLVFKKMKELKLKTEIICQVHDSLIFDLCQNEVNKMAYLSTDICRKLPEYMRKVWGINFNIPMKGEFETGVNCGKMEKLII